MNPALSRIQSFPITWQHESSSARKDIREKVDILDLTTVQGPELPAAVQAIAPAETALLYTSLSQNSYKEDAPWGELNHTSFVWRNAHAKPLLAMDNATWANGTEQANPLRELHVPAFESGESRWMELVVNNIDDRGHPFHLVRSRFLISPSKIGWLTVTSMGMNSM